MSWFEKLKKVIDINIHHLINITFVKNESSKEKLRTLEDGKRIEINTSALDGKELEETKQFLCEQFNKRDATFLEKGAKEEIDDIKEKLNLRTIRDTLDFYRDKISPEYLDALEASLYLREAFKEDKDIERMKRDIIQHFGPIGKNISNLCSSGYFEGYIMELYLEMSRQPNFTLQKFQQRFKEIVRDSPFTVFVNQYRKKEDIKNEINIKLRKFQDYGIGFLAVHGIGTENVKIIRETLSELENERNDIKTEMALESSIIQLKIMFK